MIKEKSLITLKDEIKSKYPFSNDLPMIYLGEIYNMPEHSIFIGKSGKCYFGYHVNTFRELTENEI